MAFSRTHTYKMIMMKMRWMDGWMDEWMDDDDDDDDDNDAVL